MGFPSFRDALGLWPGVSTLKLLYRQETFLHVEAALEASPHPAREIIVLLELKELPTLVLGALAMVSGGASARTIGALWEAIDRGHAPPPLVLVALLVDPEFERQATSRLEATAKSHVRGSLAWALERLTGTPWRAPDWEDRELRHAESVNRRWLRSLREHVEPRLQTAWPLLIE